MWFLPLLNITLQIGFLLHDAGQSAPDDAWSNSPRYWELLTPDQLAASKAASKERYSSRLSVLKAACEKYASELNEWYHLMDTLPPLRGELRRAYDSWYSEEFHFRACVPHKVGVIQYWCPVCSSWPHQLQKIL